MGDIAFYIIKFLHIQLHAFEWMCNFKYGNSSAELGAGSLETVLPDFES